MSSLFIYKEKVESIFQLLGQKENDLSFSVGYALSICPSLLINLIKEVEIDTQIDTNKIKINLQKFEKEKGLTDFEIFQENDFHIIIEAKRGWIFPTELQLQKYASRPTFKNSRAKEKRIIVLNESTSDFARAHFKSNSIETVPVQVISWHTIRRLSSISLKTSNYKERNLLSELIKYLERFSSMQKVDSNWVYVVSLGWNKPDKWKINWQDIVNVKRKYFHPVGGCVGGWPAEPPNYIAFRYGGKLQSIHHIDKYEVFNDPSKHFNEIPEHKWDQDHYLYYLGPPIKPIREVKAGPKIIRNIRVWAMLDLLLTSETIQEARDKSRERERKSFNI